MESFLSFWSSNFIINLFSKLLSFVSNQFLIRLLDQKLFGIWAVRLSLISDTIVFWSRDGVRKAAAKSGNSSTYKKYCLIPIIIGLVISPFVLYASYVSGSDISGFGYAVILTNCGALLELVGELWCIPQLSELNGSIVAKVTAFAYLFRSIMAVVLTKCFIGSKYETKVLMIVFGLCNFFFGISIVFGFILRCGMPSFEMPTKAEIKSLRPFAFQTVLQWLFSQGERMVLLMSNSNEQIGVYGMISDLCSLVARIIFAPIEASAYSAFAKSQQPPLEILQMCCKVVTYVGLLAASYGPILGPSILFKIYGSKWTNNDVKSVFAAFCRIMPFMALNGVTEAYPNARLSASRIERYNFLLLFVNIIYFVLMFVMGKKYGPSGTVYSNGVSMIIRSLLAINVIFEQIGVTFSIFPPLSLLLMFASLMLFGSHLGFKLLFATVPFVLMLIISYERELIRKISVLFKKDN